MKTSKGLTAIVGGNNNGYSNQKIFLPNGINKNGVNNFTQKPTDLITDFNLAKLLEGQNQLDNLNIQEEIDAISDANDNKISNLGYGLGVFLAKNLTLGNRFNEYLSTLSKSVFKTNPGNSQELATNKDAEAQIELSHYDQGKIFFESGEFDKAIESFTKELETNKDPEAQIKSLWSRANSYKEIRKTDKVYKDYKAILKTAKDHHDHNFSDQAKFIITSAKKEVLDLFSNMFMYFSLCSISSCLVMLGVLKWETINQPRRNPPINPPTITGEDNDYVRNLANQLLGISYKSDLLSDEEKEALNLIGKDKIKGFLGKIGGINKDESSLAKLTTEEKEALNLIDKDKIKGFLGKIGGINKDESSLAKLTTMLESLIDQDNNKLNKIIAKQNTDIKEGVKEKLEEILEEFSSYIEEAKTNKPEGMINKHIAQWGNRANSIALEDEDFKKLLGAFVEGSSDFLSKLVSEVKDEKNSKIIIEDVLNQIIDRITELSEENDALITLNNSGKSSILPKSMPRSGSGRSLKGLTRTL